MKLREREKKITFHLDHDYMTTQQFEDRECVYVTATNKKEIEKGQKMYICIPQR